MKLCSKIFVLDIENMIGKAIVRVLTKNGYQNILAPNSEALDLLNSAEVFEYYIKNKPDYVFCFAGPHGGIAVNQEKPAEFISQNLMVQHNVIHGAYLHGVKRLIFLTGSCVYPKECQQPMQESSFMTGMMEKTSVAYSTATTAGVEMCCAYNRQYGTEFIPVVMPNYYGIEDDFSENGHVLANIMIKMHNAHEQSKDNVTLFGTGNPKRQFMFVDDLADGAIYLMQHAKNFELTNLAGGNEFSIAELAEKLKKVIGYQGNILFDPEKPDGTMRKLLDNTKMTELGWKSQTDFSDGLQKTYEWFLQNSDTIQCENRVEVIEEKTIEKALDIPLMSNNIIRKDVHCLIDFLRNHDIFTQNKYVCEFEKQWSEWLGVKYSVFVNSGSSANFITMAIIKELYGAGEIIVPAITWASDFASVITAGHQPVVVDVNLHNLSMAEDKMLEAITPKTKAVFLTHVLGFNGLSQRMLDELERRNIILVEDVCESHGATFNNKKLGTFGLVSNFSFYYAHHMSTIEGGVICTNDERIYQYARMFRSHGMVRESNNEELKAKYQKEYPGVHPEFTFCVPGYNMRSTELNAVIGLSQLGRLDANNEIRYRNFKMFLDNLDAEKYYTDFDIEGSVNYAFILILRYADDLLFERVCNKLREEKVEFRRGTAGGGNEARQPFIQRACPGLDASSFKNAEHIHCYSMYIGNYPELEEEKILKLCAILNKL
ncbi:DegT/DnrJ/EryC1/StrS family aminotransferase [Anaerosinus massiliensis]|uniref:DegT/DnrJ/EryC1/StrS family aminotransferase n=1 Tax=Massilibacillus massiliensis TaxID=1806837 RepID=UPI000A41BCEF|nr:DegT/DnrJ/EryC1/StrS family aminotransferase [Massilibacillus massiliensis]